MIPHFGRTSPNRDRPSVARPASLDSDAAQRRRGGTSARDAVKPAMPANPAAPTVAHRGFVIGEEIGRGGIGLVHRARQQVFDRDIAIKRLHPSASNPAATRKFHAEALIAAQLEHPNIVPIHDLLVGAGGELSLVMKRIAGVSWRRLLRGESASSTGQGRVLGFDDHLDILLKVCDAISFAHGRGFLHCDLKPDNVMVGEFGEVVVMDWGCALAYTAATHHPDIPRVDQVTHLVGTPSYLAPEMAMAQKERFGPHSDVYQLGAILYELLTMESPHRGADVDEILEDAAWGALVPPQERAPERDIPDELADICLAALEKDPTRRLPSVAALSARLLDYRRHAEAVALAAKARMLLSKAQRAPEVADDALRQALSCAEQAVGIWPGWRNGRATHGDCLLALARHHLEVGAYGPAIVQAEAAVEAMAALGRQALCDAAADLSEEAREAEAAQAAHRRQSTIARIGIMISAVGLVIGLLVVVIVVSGEQQRTAAALSLAKKEEAKARSALDNLADEQRRRGDEQVASAPGLVEQARKAIQGQRWDDAAKTLATAIAFDPQLLEPRVLLAHVLVCAKRHSEAVAATLRWLALAPGDAHAVRLRALCALTPDGTEPAIETKIALSDLFTEEALYMLAERFAVTLPIRLELYRKRIDTVWPGAGDGLAMRDDGRLVTSVISEAKLGFEGRGDVIDLTPLAGMPFAVLNLRRTRVADLGPLRGMPLEELMLDRTPVSSLEPLVGMPLRALGLAGTKVAELAPLRGMRLEWLDLADTGVADLTAVMGMSFKHLDISGTAVESVAPLSGTSHGEIIARRTRIHALSPLLGTPIDSLDLTGCALDDISILARLPVHRYTGLSLKPGSIHLLRSSQIAALDLIDTSWLSSLEALRGMRLVGFAVHHSKIRDLSPLRGMPLAELDCQANPLDDLSPLADMPLTRLDISDCPVRDLSPLRAAPLVALRAEDSAITDLEPLRGKRIKLLYIDHTPVRDLAPLAGMPLEDVRVGPFNGQPMAGIDALRRCPTLRSIGTSRDQALAPAEFWRRYDAGQLP